MEKEIEEFNIMDSNPEKLKGGKSPVERDDKNRENFIESSAKTSVDVTKIGEIRDSIHRKSEPKINAGNFEKKKTLKDKLIQKIVRWMSSSKLRWAQRAGLFLLTFLTTASGFAKEQKGPIVFGDGPQYESKIEEVADVPIPQERVVIPEKEENKGAIKTAKIPLNEENDWTFLERYADVFVRIREIFENGNIPDFSDHDPDNLVEALKKIFFKNKSVEQWASDLKSNFSEQYSPKIRIVDGNFEDFPGLKLGEHEVLLKMIVTDSGDSDKTTFKTSQSFIIRGSHTEKEPVIEVVGDNVNMKAEEEEAKRKELELKKEKEEKKRKEVERLESREVVNRASYKLKPGVLYRVMSVTASGVVEEGDRTFKSDKAPIEFCLTCFDDGSANFRVKNLTTGEDVRLMTVVGNWREYIFEIPAESIAKEPTKKEPNRKYNINISDAYKQWPLQDFKILPDGTIIQVDSNYKETVINPTKPENSEK